MSASIVLFESCIETLWVLAIGLTLIYGFDFLLKTLRGYFIDVAGKRADIALSSTLFEQVMNRRLDVGREPIGSLANNLREFDSLRDFFTSATLTTLVDLPFVLLFIGAIWAVGGLQRAAVPVLAIPVVVFGGLAVALPLRDRIKRSFSASETKYATLIETLAAIETVKTLGGRLSPAEEAGSGNQFLANESMGTKLLTSIAINFSMLVQVAVFRRS
jgi:ATP-binding cassette subfamily C protein LapB